MAKNNKQKTYWPHMIMGFVMVGVTLGYWTVKSAIALPVQESNEFMLKYQQADMNINEIMEKKARFDQSYMIDILNTKSVMLELENAKRAKEEKEILLHLGKNSFSYRISKKEGAVVKDANVTFLLTRPHSRTEDVLRENIQFSNGTYTIKDVNITKAGRYTLQLRAKIGDVIGYSQLPAYIKP